jgi:hypothetical protein
MLFWQSFRRLSMNLLRLTRNSLAIANITCVPIGAHTVVLPTRARGQTTRIAANGRIAQIAHTQTSFLITAAAASLAKLNAITRNARIVIADRKAASDRATRVAIHRERFCVKFTSMHMRNAVRQSQSFLGVAYISFTSVRHTHVFVFAHRVVLATITLYAASLIGANGSSTQVTPTQNVLWFLT